MSSRQSWLGALPGAKKVYGGNAGKKKQPAAKARAPLRTLQTNALATVDEDSWLAPSRKNACATPEEKAPKPRARTTTTMAARESSALFVDSSSDEEPEAKSKGKGLEGAVAAGADEDVAWLREALGAEGFVSFGKRTVRVPRSWRRSRRSRVIGWCEDLGFRCVATAESTILEMSSRAVGELREKLAARGGDAPEPAESPAPPLEVVEAPRAAARPPPPVVERDTTIDLTALLDSMRFKAPPPPADDAAPPPPADDDADEAADAFDASARGAPSFGDSRRSTTHGEAARLKLARRRSMAQHGLLRRQSSVGGGAFGRASGSLAAAFGRTSASRASGSLAPARGSLAPGRGSVALWGVAEDAVAVETAKRGEAAAARVAPRFRGDARRDVVGAWLTGEARRGRCVVEAGAAARGGACVVDVVPSARGGLRAVKVALARDGARGVAVVETEALGTAAALAAAAAAAWPAGLVVRGRDDDYFLPAALVGARLPALATLAASATRLLPGDAWRRVLAFAGDRRGAAAACRDAARAAEAAAAAAAGRLALGGAAGATRTWASVAAAMPAGRFLSEGAFKRVFAVGDEAVGVADLALLGGDAGAAAEAAKELEISTRLAQLLDRGCCPNFVAARGAFACDAPPGAAWGGAAAKGNRRKKGARWLYARMELCGHGDVEGWLRSLPAGALPDDATRALFFQMCFSLYASRAALGLRHYDVKLLNFLAAPVAKATVARYAVGPAAFDLRLDPALCGAWAKLADFGTSRCDAASLGAHADGSLLTTVENAPADLLVAGDAADFHGFAHDTFSLGLAAVHLFGGCAPYEELMAACTCPAPLRGALAKLWLADGGGFGAVARTCRTVYDDDGAGNSGDASSDDDGVGEPYDRTLFDTLYRFFVLLGVPREDALGPAGQPVLAAARDHLLGDAPAGTKKKKKAATKAARRADQRRAKVRKRFADDAARFDLETGDAPAIARCRARFGEHLPLLKAMLAFDAAQRPTMRALLLSPLFAPLRATGELRADAVFATFARRDDAAPIPDV